jgi:hypothetical protein
MSKGLELVVLAPTEYAPAMGPYGRTAGKVLTVEVL